MKNFFAVLALLFAASTASASGRVVELVLPYAPGGTADKLAQTILPILRNELSKSGITPVVTFKPGGGSTIGARAVAKAEPGTAQMVLMSNSIVQAPVINQLPNVYDVGEDFKLLGYLGHLPMIMVVNTDTNIQNFAEFQALCRQGRLSYGTGGIGTSSHITTAIIAHRAGCDAPAGHFKGLGPMLISLAGNHVNFGTDYPHSLKALITANKLRPIVIFDQQRLSAYPDVPTIKEVGIDLKLENWFILAVNSTAHSADIVTLSQAVAQTLNNQELQSQLRELGFKNINSRVPANFLVTEQNSFIKTIKNIKLDVK